MSRMKLVVLSLLAAFALSAVATSTASAVTHEFKVEEKTIAKGSKVEVNGQAGVLGQFEGELAEKKIHITCNQPGFGVKGANFLEAEGKAKLKIEFLGCTAYNINKEGKPENLPECKIVGGKAVAEATGELEQSEPGLIKFGITESGSNLEIEKQSHKCPLAEGGKLSVSGSQICSIPSYGFESTMGVLFCAGAGSNNLKFNGKPAKIYVAAGVAGTGGQKLGQT